MLSLIFFILKQDIKTLLLQKLLHNYTYLCLDMVRDLQTTSTT